MNKNKFAHFTTVDTFENQVWKLKLERSKETVNVIHSIMVKCLFFR